MDCTLVLNKPTHALIFILILWTSYLENADSCQPGTHMNSSSCDLFWVCVFAMLAVFPAHRWRRRKYFDVFFISEQRLGGMQTTGGWLLFKFYFVCITEEISSQRNVLFSWIFLHFWPKTAPDLFSIEPSASSTLRQTQTAVLFKKKNIKSLPPSE